MAHSVGDYRLPAVNGYVLAGVEEVIDRAALADALAARGHSRGAAYHLPALDE